MDYCPKFTPIARILFYIFNDANTIDAACNSGARMVLHRTGSGICKNTNRCVCLGHLKLGDHTENMADISKKNKSEA